MWLNHYVITIYIVAAAAIQYVFDEEIQSTLRSMFHQRISENNLESLFSTEEIFPKSNAQEKFVCAENTVC